MGRARSKRRRFGCCGMRGPQKERGGTGLRATRWGRNQGPRVSTSLRSRLGFLSSSKESPFSGGVSSLERCLLRPVFGEVSVPGREKLRRNRDLSVGVWGVGFPGLRVRCSQPLWLWIYGLTQWPLRLSEPPSACSRCLHPDSGPCTEALQALPVWRARASGWFRGDSGASLGLPWGRLDCDGARPSTLTPPRSRLWQ